jgi:hypothetical protein
MTGKGKQRTPPDLMSELLGSLQEDAPLPGQRPAEPAELPESAEQHDTESTEQLVDKSTQRLVDLSARPQTIKAKTRKRDGLELTRKTHYLTPDQARLLKEYAFMTDQGESEVVRRALDEFFQRHGRNVWEPEHQDHMST